MFADATVCIAIRQSAGPRVLLTTCIISRETQCSGIWLQTLYFHAELRSFMWTLYFHAELRSPNLRIGEHMWTSSVKKHHEGILKIICWEYLLYLPYMAHISMHNDDISM